MLKFATIPRNRLAERRPASLVLQASANATIEDTSPPWIREVNRRMSELRDLKPNWDHEGAPAIDFECCINALIMLLECAANETSAPQIVPTSAGGVQLEWHQHGIDLEVWFNPGDEPNFYLLDEEEGQEVEATLSSQMPLVRGLLRATLLRNECDW